MLRIWNFDYRLFSCYIEADKNHCVTNNFPTCPVWKETEAAETKRQQAVSDNAPDRRLVIRAGPEKEV